MDNFLAIRLDAGTRKYFIQKVIDYYALHIEGFGEVKSHIILEEVLNP